MSTPDDARSRAIALPPALLEEIVESSEAYDRFTRGQLALIQHEMVTKLRANPDASVSQYAVVHERLSKNAKLDAQGRQVGPGAGFSVVINLGETKKATTVDVVPTKVEAE